MFSKVEIKILKGMNTNLIKDYIERGQLLYPSQKSQVVNM